MSQNDLSSDEEYYQVQIGIDEILISLIVSFQNL